MKTRIVSFILLLGMIFSLFGTAQPVQAAEQLAPGETQSHTARYAAQVEEGKIPAIDNAVKKYTLKIKVVGNGVVAKKPSLSSYRAGQQVTLAAVPANGWYFSGWGGACTGSEPCTLVMNSNKVVYATFDLIPPTCYALTISHTGEGADPITTPEKSKECEPGNFYRGEKITLSQATPTIGWKVNSWTGTNDDASSQATNLLIMPGEDHSVAVNYDMIEYNLTISPTVGGSISVDRPGPYYYGDEVELTASAVPGYTFANWNGDLAGTDSVAQLVFDADKTVGADFSQNHYTLDITITGSGTVTKSPDQETYVYGDQVTLTATPVGDWTFLSWGGACNGNGSCVITIDDNEAVTATFWENEYPLTITQATGGTISANPAPPYHLNNAVTLTATPTSGWSFSAWTGDCAGQSNPCHLTMNAAKSVSATYTQNHYNLTVNVVGNGSVTKSPDQAYYLYGNPVTLTPLPAVGWSFSSWSGACTGSGACVVTMNDNRTVTATFTQNHYTLTVNVTGSGTVAKSPDQTTYTHGTSVTLTQNAAVGWTFSSWGGACSGSGTCTVVMDGNKTVSATFTQNRYTLTINITGSGSVSKSPDAATYTHGTIVNLTPAPVAGWSFSTWGGACSGSGACAVTMDGNKTVSATFTQNQYTLTVNVTGSGAVSRSPNQATYTYGTLVTLTPTPVTGWSFSNWGGACTGSGTCRVTMNDNRTVSATFVQTVYALTITQTTGGIISASPAAPYHLNDAVTVTATPNVGWYFSAWTGDCSGQSNPCHLTMNSAKNVSGTFHQTGEGTLLPKDLIAQQGTLREDFESLSGWTVGGTGTDSNVSVDTTNHKSGSASVRITAPSTGWVDVYKTVNWDLSAANERGNMRFWVYVPSTAEPTGFSFILSNDTEYQNFFTTWYNDDYTFRYRPGWNLINIRSSDWSASGTATWDQPIRGIIIRVQGAGTQFSVDGLTTGVVGVPAVLFTFDDSMTSLYDTVYSHMNSRNVRGTSYNVTDWVGGATQVSWTQLQEMYTAGWTIGNHTKSHVNLSTLSEAQQEAELLGARTALNDHGMVNVNYVAYPFGGYNANTLTAINNLGMRSARTLLYFNIISPVVHPSELPQRSIGNATSYETVKGWVDTAKSRQEILIFTFHGVSSTPGSNDWYTDRFQTLVDYCIQQGVPIITMDDLYSLQSANITIPVASIP